jgi:hypothetical protein
MPELRPRARRAAAAEAAPAPKPAPKRKPGQKPPKSTKAPKKAKAGNKPTSGGIPTPAVGATPAADDPPSPNEIQDLADDPNTVNAEAQDQTPPKPTPSPPSDDEQPPPLILERVVDVNHGAPEVGILVDPAMARSIQDHCPQIVVTLANGHAIIARLADALAFAASSVPTSVRILTVGVKLPAVMAAIQKIETAAGLKGPVPFQELLVAASHVRDDEVINLGLGDLYE